MIRKLKTWASGKGRLAVLGMTDLAEARGFIAGLKKSGQLDDRLYRTQLAGLVRQKPGLESRFQSIILLSVQRPAHRLVFETESGPFTCLLPPTYAHYRRLGGELLKDLRKYMGRDLPKTLLLKAPLKRLAMLSGLVSYGRNNVTYSGEYGSYHQLVGLVSEAELEPFSPEPKNTSPVLPACASCSACRQRCPTGAIDRERFLIHAEKCLTLFNESPGRLPPVYHKLDRKNPCLVGCLACQTVCPANKGKLRIEEAAVTFSVAETRHLLEDRGNGGDPTWQSIAAKLKTIGIPHYQNRVPRNLRFLMSKAAAD